MEVHIIFDTEHESSLIKTVYYIPEKRELYIEFKKNNAQYVYYEVTKGEFDALLAAESAGKYLKNEIIPTHESEICE